MNTHRIEELPTAQVNMLRTAKKAQLPSNALKAMKVALVEAETSGHTHFTIATYQGHHVTAAPTAAEARHLVAEVTPDGHIYRVNAA